MRKLLPMVMVLVLNPKIQWIGKIGLFFGLYVISTYVFADSTDLLANTTSDALSTINGSGRNWAYIIDGAISLGAFAKTKNPFVFFSVLGVALGITVICKMAGGT